MLRSYDREMTSHKIALNPGLKMTNKRRPINRDAFLFACESGVARFELV